MLNWFNNIHQKRSIIQSSSSVPDQISYDDSSQIPTQITSNTLVPVNSFEPLKRNASTFRDVINTKSHQEFLEVGETLSEMVELDEEDEWKIEEQVYTIACRIAAELMYSPYPAPRIFNHGPKSVVFNWTRETKNLYLTIGSSRISAMLSTPERIENRINISIDHLQNPSLFLSSIQPSPGGGQAYTFMKASSDPLELLEQP